MPLNSETLAKLLRTGDVDAIVKFFARATEDERRAVAAQVIKWAKFLNLHWRGQFNQKAKAELEKDGPLENWHELMPAAYAAALASASLPEIKSISGSGGDRIPAASAVAIFKARRPSWLGEYAEILCESELGTWRGHWNLVRAVVRAGLCKPPKHDNYVIEGLVRIWGAPYERNRDAKLVDLLLNERDWLETDFWRLFEIDGNSEVSLANCDKYGKTDSWSDALVELSRRKILSRNRLLNASLEALSRDFIQYRAGWFSRFHEALEPTASERAERIDAYFRLVASAIPPTVAYAVNAIAAIDKAKPIPAGALVDALHPALNARGKAVVKSSLQILATAAKRDAAARPKICLAALPALLNEAVDVQKAVLDLLEAHGDKNCADLRAKLDEHSGAVAASLKARLIPWLGSPKKETASAREPAVRQKAPSRIDTSRAIHPIENLDDLIHRAGAVLEEPSDPDEIERVIDGVCRLCDQRPADFAARTAPLRKRAMQKRGEEGKPRWLGEAPLQRVFAMLIVTWIDGADRFTETGHELARHLTEQGFLFRRFIMLGQFIAKGRSMPALSTPTHRGGWIEPQALVKRWLAWQKADLEPDVHEQVLALLRLAPEGRDKALNSAKKLTGECGDAVRLALGAKQATGKSAPLWLAVWRSRQPHGDLPEFEAKHPRLGPDAGMAAQFSWSVKPLHNKYGDTKWTSLEFELRINIPFPKKAGDALLPVLFHGADRHGSSEEKVLIRYSGYLWPSNREAFFARACNDLKMSVQWSDVDHRDNAAFVEFLADPFTELRPMACLALALGLAAQENALRGLAQDALIAAISDSRLKTADLGQSMSTLLDTGFNKFVRCSKSLLEVSRVSSLHANAVTDVLLEMLHGDPSKAPRDISALLELLFELLIQTERRIEDDKVLFYLSSLKAAGKTAKLVKQLLELCGKA